MYERTGKRRPFTRGIFFHEYFNVLNRSGRIGFNDFAADRDDGENGDHGNEHHFHPTSPQCPVIEFARGILPLPRWCTTASENPLSKVAGVMRSGSDQRPRGRFNANRPSQPRGPHRNQTLSTHGPRERIQGNAFQIYQRYLTLAQEAARSDDRIAAENYYQHAEHYFRVNNETRGGGSAGTSKPIDRDAPHPSFVGEAGETLIEQAQPREDGDQPYTVYPDL